MTLILMIWLGATVCTSVAFVLLVTVQRLLLGPADPRSGTTPSFDAYGFEADDLHHATTAVAQAA